MRYRGRYKVQRHHKVFALLYVNSYLLCCCGHFYYEHLATIQLLVTTKMPYVLISTLIRLECGPTVVGDEWSDPALMELLGAKLIVEFGNNFKEYRSPHPPRIILNKLETQGYHLVSMTGVGQTCIWTCYKDSETNQVKSTVSS